MHPLQAAGLAGCRHGVENTKLGVSYNSAMQTMREREDSQPLRGIVDLDDAYLGGETSGGKRRRGATRPYRGGRRSDASENQETVAPEPRARL